MKTFQRICLISAMIALTSACSTRGPVDIYDGSTAQRLVSYSVDDLMTRLPKSELSELKGQKVWVATHFIAETEALTYATERLKLELKNRFELTLVDTKSEAEVALDVFFTSLGTDKDTWGLSIPVFWTLQPGEESSLDLLAVKMFHGVSELYFFKTDLASEQVTKSKRILSRSRADVFATPIFSFPVDDLDEQSITDSSGDE